MKFYESVISGAANNDTVDIISFQLSKDQNISKTNQESLAQMLRAVKSSSAVAADWLVVRLLWNVVSPNAALACWYSISKLDPYRPHTLSQ